MGASLDWLNRQVNNITFDEALFRVKYEKNKYIIGAIYTIEKDEVDIFSISSVYDTIIDLNTKIQYSFEEILKCNISEDLMEHRIFEKQSKIETKALYYLENMIFRLSTLWDMLAQLCNIFWKKGKAVDNIYVESFFHDCNQGKNKKLLAKDVYSYFKETDKINGDLEKWEGNFEYVKEYRNQMTHRNSPNFTILSNYGIHIKPPFIFVLKRVTEDYLKVIEFIKRILNDILIVLNR